MILILLASSVAHAGFIRSNMKSCFIKHRQNFQLFGDRATSSTSRISKKSAKNSQLPEIALTETVPFPLESQLASVFESPVSVVHSSVVDVLLEGKEGEGKVEEENEEEEEMKTLKPKRKPRKKKGIAVVAADSEEDSKAPWLLQFDGGSRGNPGRAGAGAVIYKPVRKSKSAAELANAPDNLKEVWNGFFYLGENKTCNYAEYMALASGLQQAVKMKIPELVVQGDSQLVVRQLLGQFQVRDAKMKELHKLTMDLLLQLKSYTIVHIPREFNKRADYLSNKAMDQMKSDTSEKIDPAAPVTDI